MGNRFSAALVNADTWKRALDKTTSTDLRRKRLRWFTDSPDTFYPHTQYHADKTLTFDAMQVEVTMPLRTMVKSRSADVRIYGCRNRIRARVKNRVKIGVRITVKNRA